MRSDVLGLELHLDGDDLRLFDPVSGERLPTFMESEAGRRTAEAGRRTAEAGRRTAEAGRRTAEADLRAAEARIALLERRLREM